MGAQQTRGISKVRQRCRAPLVFNWPQLSCHDQWAGVCVREEPTVQLHANGTAASRAGGALSRGHVSPAESSAG